MAKDAPAGGAPDQKEVQKAAKSLALAFDKLADTNAELKKKLGDADKSVDALMKEDEQKAQAERYKMLQDFQDTLAKSIKEQQAHQTAIDKTLEQLKKYLKS